MAYAGGIGQEIDQLKDLSVQELVRRQNLDPSLIYTIALQEKEKMNAAGARQGVLDEPKPEGTVTSRMEQNLASRLAPGIQQQGQRSMQRAQPQPQPQPQQGPQGISGVPANNMGAVGRARGGIIGYANGGMLPQAQIPTIGAQQAAPATPEQIAAFEARLKELNEAKANAFPQEKAMFQQQIQDLLDTTPAAIRNAAGGAGMAQGGVVGYAPGGEVDMEALLDALMIVESKGDPDAVSSAGAEGAYQIMPSTAEQPGFGVPPMEGDRFDPEASRAFARQYLQAMIDRYDGDIEAGLIAYNAGAGNADKFIAANRDYDVLPQTMQTQPYVRRIMGQLEKEGRRRDFQLGGGRTISTTAPEGYTERRRRERLEKQEAGLASRYPEVAMEEAEMYEPNLPDALAVMQGISTLRDGAVEAPVPEDLKFVRGNTRSPVEIDGRPVEGYTQRNTRERREANAPAEGIAGYLQNIGRQQQLRRDDFRRAVPGAEAAVARAEKEKEDGGIGYLRRLGRLQEGAAQRQAEESERAAKFMAMMQQNEDMLAVMDPAENMPIREFQSGGGVKRFNGEEDGSFIDTLGNMQRSAYEATKDYMPDFGNIVSGQMENAVEDPLNYAANALLSVYGGGVLLRGGARVLGPIAAKYGPQVLQRARALALRATTKPNPEAVPRVGNKPGQITRGVTQPSQGVRGPGGRMQAGPPGRVFDPLKVGVGTGLAIKAGDALFGEDEATGPTNPVEYLQDIGRQQEEAGTIEAFRAKRRAEEAAQRNRPPDKTGISGALEKAKPLGGLALRIAEVLGRGAGASKGFEGAKILEESSRLRSEEAKMQLNRDQIAATTGQSEARAAATVNAAILKLVGEYQDPGNPAYRTALTAKAAELALEEDNPQVINAVIEDYVALLRNNMGSISSMQGLGNMGGLGGGGLSDPYAGFSATQVGE